ncbi:glycoside hydrolase superfamily [Trichoderma austrokoningii]
MEALPCSPWGVGQVKRTTPFVRHHQAIVSLSLSISLFTSALVFSSCTVRGENVVSMYGPPGDPHREGVNTVPDEFNGSVGYTHTYIYCLSLPRDGWFLFSSSSRKALVYWLIHHIPFFTFLLSIDSNTGSWLTIHSFVSIRTSNFSIFLYPTFFGPFHPTISSNHFIQPFHPTISFLLSNFISHFVMLYHTLLAGLGLAGLAGAAPTKRNSGAQNVVYWGATPGSSPLSDYCKPNAGIDVLVLSFLNAWGVGGNIPSGSFGGDACPINADGTFGPSCSTMASQIKTCQSAGIKVMVSLGGASGAYSLMSQSQAETIGQYLWDAYGKSGSATVKRPFGDVAIDGWDFDLESNVGSQYYQYLISTLRSNFAKDTSKKYYISGAPQCPLPEANMGDIMQNSVFDYLFVQFYNNPKRCSVNAPDSLPINWGEWTKYVSSTKSSSAKLFVGAPAAPGGAGSGYVPPSTLATVVNGLKSDPYFGGVMLWDAHWSDQNPIAGCTFAQQVKSILTTGTTCKGTPVSPAPASNSTAASPPPATSSVAYPAPASTSTASSPPPPAGSSPASALSDNSSSHASEVSGGVAQWGQCGGEGYTGPTQCQSPFKCVKEGTYWSSCQ